jgi:hypothetical protein
MNVAHLPSPLPAPAAPATARYADAPLGVPLQRLHARLWRSGGGIEIEREENLLRLPLLYGTTEVRVEAPATTTAPNGNRKQAVIRVHTELRWDVQLMYHHWTYMTDVNSHASLTAFSTDNRGAQVYAASRLTVDAGAARWDRYLPLLALAAYDAVDAMLIGVNHFIRTPYVRIPTTDVQVLPENKDPARMAARRQALNAFADLLETTPGCTLTRGDDAVDLHVPLGTGRPLDDYPFAARLRISNSRRHPAYGEGWHWELRMPHRTRFCDNLELAMMHLNAAELRDEDGPAHFGAWTIVQGEPTTAFLEGGPSAAYVAFVPDALALDRDGLLEITRWQIARARRASAPLASDLEALVAETAGGSGSA